MANDNIARRPRGAARDDSPQYRVHQESYIDNKLIPAGTENVTYWGVPGKFLEPMNDAARKNKAAANDIRRNTDLGPDEKVEALRALDDEMQGVVAKDGDEAHYAYDEPLPAAERKVLEKQSKPAEPVADAKK